ncbi:cyclic diguanylate phosphodiesterase [Citrobacter amalonaticus]|uniref:cyclic-guanylate-specific phosphodiesterase n=1 Tax=Citrobacter amalonaticus TaxID=35703 RepID=A0A2S4S1Z2_CITAM|nr:EAL domain-containing protein [Citrobacter amalonaticus]POT59294.1 cyclic diguanylate phosphodiesterase [Citrobacter amalonaticus]POT77424.1 cyclic diguanylate phosphodiesterase [Citrobacter amalonaticus]POU67876.1 cyclic diguanylate phosphodiesterase [Citrobacter amalonaticus]POV07480.1 cyclic diguanylate phosphodiesterase [Citrobacter amalonaticus]
MQTAQRIIKRYRRNRLIVCTICAIATLVLTLGIRFISERNINQQRAITFASHAVHELDEILRPLQTSRDILLSLIGLPCSVAHLPLRKQAARLQTVRAIALIQDGILYCSSVFGYRNIPVHQLQPTLPAPEAQLLLSTDPVLLKGTPILLQWYPSSPDGTEGVLEMVNIDLLMKMLFQPQQAQITSASLTVGNRHLLYGHGVVETLPLPDRETRYQVRSQHFPFTISVTAPGASALALQQLPSQLPLAVLLSLLVAYIAWLATARRMSFSWEINLGLAQREFELFCQPLLNARTEQCMGVEILLRWNNPRQGWISPDVFIPIAEEQHLIAPLTRYVIAETIRQRHVFPVSSQFHIGINVAASHFRDGVLLKDLNQYWFSAQPIQQLVLELTERDALLDVDAEMVNALHHQHIKLAIDDFGTGNSSLSWLEKLHPDVLKIDKSFTNAIGTDAVNSTVTDIIIALGQRLHIELVAEGVETQEQAQHLRHHGVHLLQGYLYARPMPLQDFPQWLSGSMPPPARHNGHMSPVMPLH